MFVFIDCFNSGCPQKVENRKNSAILQSCGCRKSLRSSFNFTAFKNYKIVFGYCSDFRNQIA